MCSARDTYKTRAKTQEMAEQVRTALRRLPGKAVDFGIDYKEKENIWHLVVAKFTTAKVEVNLDNNAETINRVIKQLHEQFDLTTKILAEMVESPVINIDETLKIIEQIREITHG